jgi:hypothetical protein
LAIGWGGGKLVFDQDRGKPSTETAGPGPVASVPSAEAERQRTDKAEQARDSLQAKLTSAQEALAGAEQWLPDAQVDRAEFWSRSRFARLKAAWVGSAEPVDAQNDKLQRKLDKKLGAINLLGHSSHRRVEMEVYYGLLRELQLREAPNNQEDIKRKLRAYVADVVLSAGWYTRQCRRAALKTWMFILVNAAMVVTVPLGLGLLGLYLQNPSAGKIGFLPLPAFNNAAGAFDTILPMLTMALTGVFAIQKTMSAFFAAQQNYGMWYQSGTDLRNLHFNFIRVWGGGKAAKAPEAFAEDLDKTVNEARQVLDKERSDYFKRLVMPNMDVLTMLTEQRSKVADIVSGIRQKKATSEPVTAV